jgi:hypothetical protein
MKKRKILVLISIIIFPLLADNSSGDCIKTLYSNRDYLIELYSKCKPINYAGKLIIPCCGKEGKITFDSIISKSTTLQQWHANKDNILDFFFALYGNATRIEDSTTYYYEVYQNGDCVNDDSLVTILVSCLSDTTSIATKVLPKCFQALFQFTAYPQLIKHAKLINRTENKINTKYVDYLKLKVLVNNKKDFVDSLLKNNDLPIEYRARLGDSVAEQKLIELFDQENDYKTKALLVNKLIFVGSKKCLSKLIFKLNDTLTSKCNGLTVETLRWPILKGFRKLYPTSEFSHDFIKLVNSGNKNDPELIKSVDKKFIEWAYNEFKIKPERDCSVYILEKSCEFSN